MSPFLSKRQARCCLSCRRQLLVSLVLGLYGRRPSCRIDAQQVEPLPKKIAELLPSHGDGALLFDFP